MSNLLDNINKGIAELHPYEPGRSIDEVVAEYKPDKVVKLASNENPLEPSPKAADILSQANNLHLYPDGDSKKLKSLIASHEVLTEKNIIVGNGSNEVLELAGITNEDLIPEEMRVLTVSRSGYAKTQPLDEYREQRRGGQGKAAAAVKEEAPTFKEPLLFLRFFLLQ